MPHKNLLTAYTINTLLQYASALGYKTLIKCFLRFYSCFKIRNSLKFTISAPPKQLMQKCKSPTCIMYGNQSQKGFCSKCFKAGTIVPGLFKYLFSLYSSTNVYSGNLCILDETIPVITYKSLPWSLEANLIV